MSKQNAVKGLKAAIAGLEAARKALEEVIAEKRFNQQKVDRELREKARINRKLNTLRKRKAQAEAAPVIVSAPTLAEIRSVTALIKKVEQMALADAMRKAGVDLIVKLSTEASTLGKKVT